MDEFLKMLVTGPAADAGAGYIDEQTGCYMKRETLPCGHSIYYKAEDLQDFAAIHGEAAAEKRFEALKAEHRCP